MSDVTEKYSDVFARISEAMRGLNIQDGRHVLCMILVTSARLQPDTEEQLKELAYVYGALRGATAVTFGDEVADEFHKLLRRPRPTPPSGGKEDPDGDVWN